MEFSKSKSVLFVICLALVLTLSTARFIVPDLSQYHSHHRHRDSYRHSHSYGHGQGHEKARNFSALYAFGDSLVDTGNNNGNLLTTYRSNHAPYGQDFPYHASTGRSSNGKLIVDFLVSSLGLKDTLPAYNDRSRIYDELLTGVSFGSGGAGLDDQTSHSKFVPTMDQQADTFEQAVETMMSREGGRRTRQIVKDALFVVSVGTSDMADNYHGPVALRRTQMDVPAYHDHLLARLSYFLQRLYGIGARNFVVLGMLPIGCLPSQVFSPSNIARDIIALRVCMADRNVEAEDYNIKLRDLISRINCVVPKIKVEYADIYEPVMDMVYQSYAYEIERTTEGCCGGGIPLPAPLAGTACVEGSPKCQNPDRYLFWDAINPTQVVNTHLSQRIEEEVLRKFR